MTAESRPKGEGARSGGPGAAPTDSYKQPLPLRIHFLTRAMNMLGTLWIVCLMVLINADVFGRNLLSAPVRGATELVALSIVGIVFLQLPDTLHSGGLTRATVILDSLQARRPRVAALLQAIHHLIGAAFMLVILRAAWAPLLESVRIREYVGAIGDFTAPVWPVRLITLIGLAMTALVFVFLAFADVIRLANMRPAGGGRDSERAV